MSNKQKVLVVDDEVNISMAIQFLMEDNGFEVAIAFNGEEALGKMAVFKPDLVLLDVMMPKMNGFEVAKTIRQNPANMDVKIIFLTAKGTDRDKMEGYGSGGDVYLTKPFDNQELVDPVKETLAFG
jgi:two-component system response regulator MprA